MKIIVTGAGSFVAYHLISRLLNQSHEVIGIDVDVNENTADLNKINGFTFYQEDVTKSDGLSGICHNADVIYHLAAISSERFCRENTPESVRVNVLGTLRMLEAARSNKSLFIFSSSASVYPDTEAAKKEEMADFTDRFYGTSKLLAEKYAQLYGKNFEVPYVILRFSRIFGPRMQRNPVYDICVNLANEKTVKLYENPKSKYDFIYVQDVASAFISALDKKWHNQTVNISSHKLAELNKIYEQLCDIAAKKQPLEVMNDKLSVDWVDNSRALGLGWQQEYKLPEALRETFEWFKS